MCPAEYLSENPRPQVCCNSHTPYSLRRPPRVPALSSDWPRAESDAFEAGAGPDGVGEAVDTVSALLMPVS